MNQNLGKINLVMNTQYRRKHDDQKENKIHFACKASQRSESSKNKGFVETEDNIIQMSVKKIIYKKKCCICKKYFLNVEFFNGSDRCNKCRGVY